MNEARETNERPVKVFGIIWNTKEDTFKLDVLQLLDMIEDLKIPKIYALKMTSKIFKPVGFVSPFVVLIKLLMQKMWENGLGRDDELSTELKKIGKFGALKSYF